MNPGIGAERAGGGPTPDPSQEGNSTRAAASKLPSIGGDGGGLGEIPPIIPSETQAFSATPSATSSALFRLRRIIFAPIKFIWGMASCQSVLGALAIIGWSYRLMQRAVLKQWWKLSEPARRGDSFAQFVAADPRTKEHLHWPNWFLTQNFREAVRRSPEVSFGGHALTVLKALFISFWGNVRIGVQSSFNTWVFTLPGCVLMLFGWYDGWNNSFNKGYEQFSVGPLVSLLGIALFIAAMLYVPLAQARQAVTDRWRSFYQFRLIWGLVRRRWLACVGLAALYSLCAILLLVLSSFPMFFRMNDPALPDLSKEEVMKTLTSYYFWTAAIVFPAFVALRLVAAKIYGAAILQAVQRGALSEDALSELEWQALHRLDLLHVETPRPRHLLVRLVAWAGTRAGRVTCGFMAFLFWFTLVAQTFIAAFFNYRGATAWLNHTLIQLPWHRHVPAHIQNPWGEVFLAAFLVFAGWFAARAVKSLRAWQTKRV